MGNKQGGQRGGGGGNQGGRRGGNQGDGGNQDGEGRGWHGDPEGHAQAGRKGGEKVSEDREHMAEIGRKAVRP